MKLNAISSIKNSIPLIAIFCASLLSGCQSTWNVESDFGNTVNDAVKFQTVHSEPVDPNLVSKTGLDGAAAKSAIDNYQRSLEIKSNTGAYPSGVVLSPSNSSSSGVGVR